MDILDEGTRKARKFHNCDGWHWIEDWARELGLEVCQGIKKGDEYFFQVNTYDGLRTFKCCLKCKQQASENNLPMIDD